MHLQQTIILWSGSVIHHNTYSSTSSTSSYGCIKSPHSLPLIVFRMQSFSAAQQPNSGPGRLVFYVTISHTIRHTHTQEDSSERNHLVAEADTYTTGNKHNRRTSIPSAGFEPMIAAIKRLQTNALHRHVHRDRNCRYGCILLITSSLLSATN
jgi:hypothetical protein